VGESSAGISSFSTSSAGSTTIIIRGYIAWSNFDFLKINPTLP